MTWGRSMATRLFGIKRRNRRLRHALQELAATAALATGQADRPTDAAYHDGERAAYVAALGRLGGAARAEPARPPSAPALRAAWDRGYAAAAGHAARLVDTVV